MRWYRGLTWVATFFVIISQEPQAQAAFGAFQNLDKDPVLGDVSCIAVSKGAVCTARSLDSKLAVNKLNGSKWGGWEKIGSGVVSTPSCAAVSNTAVVCAARHENGGLIIARYAKDWGKPKVVQGDTDSAPSCAGVGEDEAVCVSRGADGALVWLKTNGEVVSDFARIKGPTTTSPRCSPDNRFNVKRAAICMYGSPTATILTRRFDGKNVTQPLDIGGQSYTDVNCTELGKGTGGRVTCLAKNFNSNFFLTSFAGGAFQTTNWSSFAFIGGQSVAAGSCGAIAFNQIGCAITGTDSQFFVFQVVNGVFSGFTPLGGSFKGTPSCFALEIGKVMCVGVGIDGVARSTVGP